MSNKASAVLGGIAAGIAMALFVPLATFGLILVSSNAFLLHLVMFILMGAIVLGMIAGVATGRSVAGRIRRRPVRTRTFPTPWLSGEARA